MADIKGFFRKNGKIIPIRAAGSSRAGKAVLNVARGAALGASAHELNKARKERKHVFDFLHAKVKPNKALDAAGLGLSIASGVVGAATFTGGAKSLVGGFLAGHAIDAVGIAANAGSVAGKGKTKARTKQFAKQEARNLVIGNAVYFAGLVGVKRNRDALVGGAKRIIALGRKAVRAL